jgi:hypothetical protein
MLRNIELKMPLDGFEWPVSFNQAEWRRGEVPSVNANCSARG